MGKYDYVTSAIIRRTPEWTVCTYQTNLKTRVVTHAVLDFDEMYRYMEGY